MNTQYLNVDGMRLAVHQSGGDGPPALLNSLGTVSFKDEVQIVANLPQLLAVLHGGRERVVNGEYIATVPMPSLWRGAVQLIAEADHTPQWETPDQFDALLGAFLRETSPRR
jgi:hypothetical protein